MPTVSVVLLTNGKPELLPEVLGSILGQTHRPAEVVVVVNGRHPAIDAALDEFPGVRVVRNDRDVGFAPGMNRGVRAATGEYVYLTANDIVMAPDYLSELVRAAGADPGWGLSGGVWHNYSSAAREVIAAGGTARFGAAGLRVAVRTIVPRADGPYDTDWIPGAGIFARRAVWDALGGFREEFFAHSEDVELCLRVRRAGGYVRVVPAARLYHHEHPSGGGPNPAIEYHKLENYLAVNALHGPLAALPVVVAKFFLYTAPRVAWRLRRPGLLLRAWWGGLVRLPGWLAGRVAAPAPPPPRAAAHNPNGAVG